MYDFSEKMSELRQQGLLRTRRVVEGPQGPHLHIDGKRYLAFCSNDYLGLANHPQVIAAAHRALDQYGVGASASALICGHTTEHELLERELAEFINMSRALYFANGYMANVGIIPSLVGSGDTVFSDRLNHACLIDGSRLSGAEFRVYPHRDVARLDSLLARCKSPLKLVVTDAVFSMDGDIAPLAALLYLCEKYDAWLLVDDAHGFGVLGPQGQGSLAHCNLSSPRIIYMGTLGKAAGVSGAFVAGEKNIIEWLMQRSRTYVFSTASPPLLATALRESLHLIKKEDWRRERLQSHIRQLRDGLRHLRWKLLPSSTPVQPVLVGDNQLAVDLMEALRLRSIWVPAIRPPTVQKGTARLRVSLSAAHTAEQVAQLIDAIRDISACSGS
jgi:8-amino-7-oxononanoate synthase